LGTRSGSVVSPTRERGGKTAGDDLGAVVVLGERAEALVAPTAVGLGAKTDRVAPVADGLDVAVAADAAPAAAGFFVAPTSAPGLSRAELTCAPGSCLAPAGGAEGEEVRVGGDPVETGEPTLARESGTTAGGSALSAFLPKPQRSRRDRFVGALVGASQTGVPVCCPPPDPEWPEAGADPEPCPP
jgi:hypothetical protein